MIMTLPDNFFKAVYNKSDIDAYKGNPLIEALPPIMSLKELTQKLRGKVNYNSKDCFIDAKDRAHLISALLDDFFQPLANHVQLEEKISIMLRRGYVARNITDGNRNRRMQQGYENIMAGASNGFQFSELQSTARSLSLIGCSGSGKSETIKRIFNTYPQVIYHPSYNVIQLVYLKIECPHDGSFKSLCINFFSAVDRALHTDYQGKYLRKRHSIEVLLSLMGQVATQRSLGILVIDEIQRLTLRKNSNTERMLEFFVALVNVIGVPVVLVGTPKSRPIFELELQSGRRSVGFGSLFWEPVTRLALKEQKSKKTEWIAFTDKLWQYQWLLKKDEVLTDELRDCWYDLSQGVLDIVVKLFVLAQLRAIVTGSEKITASLLKKVYEQEFKPVHPMLAALRSGDVELINKYSDLQLTNIDKQVLDLSKAIIESQNKKKQHPFEGSETASRLFHLMLAMDCESKLLIPAIEGVVKQYPKLTVRELMPLVLEHYQQPKKAKPKSTLIKPSDWHTLDSCDLRFKFSKTKQDGVYDALEQGKEILPITEWLKKSG